MTEFVRHSMIEFAKPAKSRARGRRRRRGVGLAETIFWMVVVVLVIGGVLGLFANIMNSQRELQTRQLVQQVIAGVQGLYTSSTNYTGLSAAVLVNAGEISAQYVRGTAINTPDGGAVTLGGWDGGWSLGVANDRTDICIAVLSDFVDGSGFFNQLTGAANPASIPATLVDGSATATTIVASIAAINTACATANRNIVLEFR